MLLGNEPVTETCISANPTPGPIPSSSSGLFSGLRAQSVQVGSQIVPQVEDVFIDIPHMDTGAWHSFTVHVTNGFKVFNGLYFGWTITLLRTPASSPNAFVLPQTIPTVAPVASEGALVASVTLPEAGGPAQYWVPVLKKHKAAVLHAREWTVIFQIVPIPVPTA